MIMVYGFESTPFLTPKIVPNRIAYLEIVRKLDYSSVMNWSSFEKQSFMSSTPCFGDFTVLSKEGYDLILNKLSQFNLKKETPRKGLTLKVRLILLERR